MSEINITKISNAIPGLGITGNFITDTLGVKPARQEKRALFWNASDWPLICQRLTEHIAKGAATDITTLSGERPLPKPKAEPPAAAAGDAFFDDGAQAPAAGGDDFFISGTNSDNADMF
jgi:hypothetical protein